jgi:hypothetical protein
LVTNKIRVRLQLLIIAAAASLGVPVAHSQGAIDKSVHGVLAVGGNAGATERAAVTDAIEAALTAAGWILPEISLPKDVLDKMLGCKTPAQPWMCVPPAVSNQPIVRAMVVSVEPQRATSSLPMLAVTATVISPAKSAFVVLQRPCEQCTPDKLKQVATALVVQLLKDLASRAGDTAIEVVSSPTNAEVTLDGQKLGATDNTFTTFPGEHTLIIEKVGYEAEKRTIQVKDGQTAPVAVTLHERGSPSKLLPIGLTAGGVALIAGGIVIALDQQDGANDKFTHPRAIAVGVSVGGLGVAAVAVGVYLWLRNSGDPSPPKSAPSVAATQGGALLGWMGAF